MKYQGVFFDFDYTIGDSTHPITVGYRQGLAAMGWPEPTVDQVRHTVDLFTPSSFAICSMLMHFP